MLRSERKWIAGLFFAVTLFTAIDLTEDFFDGAEPTHLFTEGIIIAICLCSALYVWRVSVGGLRSSNTLLASELERVRNELTEWRNKTAGIYAELHDAIVTQLKAWNLSEAEADVALLLLKGLSHKEIATLRDTSEQTVRQQAASVYSKSGLEGRAQFSAFFLEDLLGSKS